MSEEQSKQRSPRRMGGPMGMAMGPGEKAKDFKGTIKKLIKYIGSYNIAIIAVIVFAIGSTVFSIAGPKILGKATTEIFTGFSSKFTGGAGINFEKVGGILIFLVCLYVISAIFSFIQGFIMSGIAQKISFRLRRELIEKINRMPMDYFDKSTHGEVLSRVTNDVDTLGMSLNQSVTQLITSVTMIIGVLIMMLTISPLLTLVTFIMLPTSGILISLTVKKSQKYFKEQQEYLGHVNGQVEEVYGGHNIVKAFNREENILNEFEKTNNVL